MLQADSVLAYRKINKMTRVICSKDTDFAALIGKDALLLRGWKLMISGRKKDNAMTMSDIEIGGACNSIVNEVKRILASAPHSLVVKWTEAKYPIFAHHIPCLCALTAVAIGCDVFIGGVKLLGSSNVFKTMTNWKKITNQYIHRC